MVLSQWLILSIWLVFSKTQPLSAYTQISGENQNSFLIPLKIFDMQEAFSYIEWDMQMRVPNHRIGACVYNIISSENTTINKQTKCKRPRFSVPSHMNFRGLLMTLTKNLGLLLPIWSDGCKTYQVISWHRRYWDKIYTLSIWRQVDICWQSDCFRGQIPILHLYFPCRRYV